MSLSKMSIKSSCKLVCFIIFSVFLLNFIYCKNYCQPEFCNNLNIHTLCKYKLPGPSNDCFDYERLIRTTKEKQDVLNKLNSRRNKIASGEIRSLPSAKNMIKLIWNEELELFAQRWADQCVNNSETDACRDLENTAVGQNVATIFGEAPGLTAPSLVDLWYMELLNINVSVLHHFVPSSVIGKESYDFFTQLVWADTKEVGCGGVKFKVLEEHIRGLEKSRTVYRLVCNFAPRGNRVGFPVYQKGVPCSQCPAGSNCDIEYNSLCAPSTSVIVSELKEEYERNHDKIDRHKDITTGSKIVQRYTTKFSSTNLGIDNDTHFDFWSYLFDVTQTSPTLSEITTKCKEMLAVDEFLQLLKNKLSNDQLLKQLLLSTSTQSATESLPIDKTVDAIINQLYTKKQTTVTCQPTENNSLDSTILADLVEAVIFRHSDKYPSTDYSKINSEPEADVGPVKIQAELAQVKPNMEFTGHYFFPEDDEETNQETTEVYDETETLPLSDVVLEIEELKRNKVTKDFIDAIFESDFVTEFKTPEVSPIDNINGKEILNDDKKYAKLNKRDIKLTKRKGRYNGLFINYNDLLKRLATDLGILKLNERFHCAYNFEQSLQPTGLILYFLLFVTYFT